MNAAERTPKPEPRKRKTFLQNYKSPIVFLLLVVASALAVRHIANTGYFETHMENVRYAASEKYLARMRNMPNASVLPSGLIFSVTRRGTGDRAPAADDVCEIHYRAAFRFRTVFEDTRDGAYPVHRSPSQLIPGAAEAMQLMRAGDKWKLIVPHTLAYGNAGNKTLNVPSIANLLYDMEIVRCPDTIHGRTTEEIDAYLAPYLKVPMPAVSDPVNFDM